MTWNYRVIRKNRRVKIANKWKMIRTYDIHEVFKNPDGKLSWTVEPVSPNGMETFKELKIVLNMMLGDALKYPVMEIVGKKNPRLVERNKKDE